MVVAEDGAAGSESADDRSWVLKEDIPNVVAHFNNDKVVEDYYFWLTAPGWRMDGVGACLTEFSW